nr:glycosyl hydrolases family 43 [uncultured bacterium]
MRASATLLPTLVLLALAQDARAAVNPNQCPAPLASTCGFRDPHNGEFFLHDPFALTVKELVGGVEKDVVYAFGTGAGISIRRSEDLVSWQFVGRVFEQGTQQCDAHALPLWANALYANWCTRPAAVWGPTVARFPDGKFHLYYAVSSFGSHNGYIGHAYAYSIRGPWYDDGEKTASFPEIPVAKDPAAAPGAYPQPWLIKSTASFAAYDSDVHVFSDGGVQRAVLTLGGFSGGVFQTELDLQTGRLKPVLNSRGQPKIVYSPVASRKNERFKAIEGAHVTEHVDAQGQRWFYLFANWDYCCAPATATKVGGWNQVFPRGAQDSTLLANADGSTLYTRSTAAGAKDYPAYQVVVGRSPNIAGPYVDRAGKPLLSGGGTIYLRSLSSGPGVPLDGSLIGPGGPSVVTVGNQDFMVLHRYVNWHVPGLNDFCNASSNPHVRKLRWSPDGWPEDDGPYQPVTTSTPTGSLDPVTSCMPSRVTIPSASFTCDGRAPGGDTCVTDRGADVVVTAVVPAGMRFVKWLDAHRCPVKNSKLASVQFKTTCARPANRVADCSHACTPQFLPN